MKRAFGFAPVLLAMSPTTAAAPPHGCSLEY